MNKISVVLPAKDRVELLAVALDSVYSQNLPAKSKLEVIVVDDNSDKPLKKILIKDYPSTIFIRNESNKSGPGYARNLGLRKASGNYIAFLDSDDAWKQGFIKNSMDLLDNSDSPATVCLSSPMYYGEFNIVLKLKLLILNLVKSGILLTLSAGNKGFLPKSGFYLCQISHMLFKKSEVGHLKFKEETVVAEDWDFVIKASTKRRVEIIPKSLVNFRYQMSSVSFSKDVMLQKEKAYYDLINKLPETHKRGLLNWLFHIYIKILLIK